MRILIFVLLLTGCASKFAPVVSRPDNLIIECETGCKFNIPMNTEVIVARNTNGYDMGKELIRQIPFIGALALSWKSMDVAENIAEASIESFNRGQASAAPTTTNNSTVTTNTSSVGDTISSTSRQTTTSSGDSDSGNSTRGDVATTGDTIGGDSAGGDIDKSTQDNDLDYSDRSITYPQSP